MNTDITAKGTDHKTFMEKEYPKLESSKGVMVLFKGTPDADGGNWCGDCVDAEPHINKVLPEVCKEKNIQFYTVYVGGRDE